MSRDIQIAWPCSHLTVEEVVPLGSDRRSLATSQPIAARGQVRVLANNDFFLPQGGLYIPAVLYGTGSGPFTLVENEDTLTIESTVGAVTISFGIRGETRWTATQVITYLKRQGVTIVQFDQTNGHLIFQETTKIGVDSFIKVSGSAAGALGFGDGSNGYQVAARGSQLYPSWELYRPPTLTALRYPRFSEALRANPVLKVTYTAAPNRCLRCRTTYIENDYRFDGAGQALMVQNEDLLYQAALKILLTDQNSNPYHPWYGTMLRSRIGTKAIAGVATLISEDVRKALSRLQALQTDQAKIQTVTFKEKLYAVLNITVKPHAQDPTTFLLDVTVQNASSEPINVTIVFTVPDVVALMGSNGLMLGPEQAGLSATQAAGLFAQSNPVQLLKDGN